MRKSELQEIKSRYIQFLKEENEKELSLKNSNYNFYKIKSDDEILSKALRYVRIKDPSNIYMYMGTFIHNYGYDVISKLTEKRVDRYDRNATYSVYRNLELKNSDFEFEKYVLIKDRLRFERENTVVVPSENNVTEEYFNEVRNMYFKEAIATNEETARQKVLKLR